MKIKSHSIKNNILHEDFGGYGKKLDKNGVPSHSMHLEWEEIPGAKSYALEVIDYEAAEVIGFPFIHWVVANIKTNFLKAGDSKNNKKITQGVNSRTPEGIVPDTWKASSIEEASKYFGPFPPDKDHNYTFRLYALDIESLDLKPGFSLGELHRAMKGHVLEEIKFVATYLKK